MKHRHDNFSFQKTIETRPRIYNTIHWEGIADRPQNPDIVIFPKLTNQMKIQENNINSTLRYRPDNTSNQSIISGRYTNGSSFRLQTYNSDDEENLLKDFKRHFSTNNRQKGNHHDFVFNKDSPI